MLPPHLIASHEIPPNPPAQDPTGEAASEAQKHLTLYELDLGLNHVVRKYSEPVDNGANLLVAVPGGGDGPGGCAFNCVSCVLCCMLRVWAGGCWCWVLGGTCWGWQRRAVAPAWAWVGGVCMVPGSGPVCAESFVNCLILPNQPTQPPKAHGHKHGHPAPSPPPPPFWQAVCWCARRTL